MEDDKSDPTPNPESPSDLSRRNLSRYLWPQA